MGIYIEVEEIYAHVMFAYHIAHCVLGSSLIFSIVG